MACVPGHYEKLSYLLNDVVLVQVVRVKGFPPKAVKSMSIDVKLAARLIAGEIS